MYGGPPGATKANPNQHAQGVEMAAYGAPQGPQQSGVVGGDVEQGGNGGEALPPRPPQKAKAVLKGFTDRFRK